LKLNSDSGVLTNAAGLQGRVALLSAIIELPKVVSLVKKELKEQEERDQQLKDMQAQNPDPLDQI
jgi:hypothetical protein